MSDIRSDASPKPDSALPPSSSSELDRNGFAIIPNVLNSQTQSELISFLGPISGPGRRGLLDRLQLNSLIRSPERLELVRPHLSLEPRPVRVLYFDKSPASNWLVPWHQDLTITVQARVETPGWGPWSIKEGITHVQPPIELLEQMLTLRLHLDKVDASNGALRVLPGSHRAGRLSADQIQQMRRERQEHLCSASAGDALLMRPLLLHASGRSTSATHRRILHIEYGAFALPSGLQWHGAT